MALIKSDTGVLNSRQIPGRYRSPELKADTGVLNSIDKQNKACNNRKSFLSDEHM